MVDFIGEHKNLSRTRFSDIAPARLGVVRNHNVGYQLLYHKVKNMKSRKLLNICVSLFVFILCKAFISSKEIKYVSVQGVSRLEISNNSKRCFAFVVEMGERGTDVAMFDYADFTESLLGLPRPFFIYITATGKPKRADVLKKFQNRFGYENVVGVSSWVEADALIKQELITDVLLIKAGPIDGRVASGANTRSLVLAVFDGREEHGHSYARISDYVPGNSPIIPHMVRPVIFTGSSLRKSLGIPENALVFCRYGGTTTFDISFVHQLICDIATSQKMSDGKDEIFFLFMNTDRFCDMNSSSAHLPHLIHINGSAHIDTKLKFISTCDALIHARTDGETFGLVIAEFSAMNRPVITSNVHGQLNHIDILGSKGLYYNNASSLKKILDNFKAYTMVHPVGDSYWNAYGSYAPIPVMQTFKKYFVDASTCPFVNKTQSNIFEKMYANIAPALMGEFQEKRVDPCARYHGCVKVRFPEIKLQKRILDELYTHFYFIRRYGNFVGYEFEALYLEDLQDKSHALKFCADLCLRKTLTCAGFSFRRTFKQEELRGHAAKRVFCILRYNFNIDTGVRKVPFVEYMHYQKKS